MAYVCFIVDAFSRMIVGWRVAAHMRTDMVLDAIEMARWSRGTRLGGAAVSLAMPGRNSPRCATANASPRSARVPSIGSVGDSFDNALAETVNGYYKAELIRGPDTTAAVEDRRGRRAGHAGLGALAQHPTACTATSATSHPPSTSRRSTLPNGTDRTTVGIP